MIFVSRIFIIFFIFLVSCKSTYNKAHKNESKSSYYENKESNFFDRYSISQATKNTASAWLDYLDKDKKNNILHISDREGALNTRNGLFLIPKHLRNRIEIIATAPTNYIDRKLSKDVTYYVSEKISLEPTDYKKKLDINNILWLTHPKKNKTLLDEFKSNITFSQLIEQHMYDFNNMKIHDN